MEKKQIKKRLFSADDEIAVRAENELKDAILDELVEIDDLLAIADILGVFGEMGLR